MRGARSRPVHAGMLVAQIALATVLCGGAGLLLRSALVLHGEDRGFDATGVLLTQVDLTALDTGDTGTAAATLAQLRDGIARQPGVTHVALADMPPFGRAEFKAGVLTASTPAPVDVRSASVEPAYFEAMGIPLLAGTVFAEQPSAEVVPVVVDELFRERWLPGSTGVGATIRIVDDGEIQELAQVVGIVSTVKQRALSEPGHPTLYRPIGSGPGVVFLVARTQADPAVLAGTVQRELQRSAPGALLMFNQPLARAIWTSTAASRSLTELAVLLGAATGFLCALGCFALIGAVASRRRAELGLRSALGATSRRNQLLVLRQGAVLVATGVLAGTAIGIVLSHGFGDRLYRTAPTDATTWLAAALLVAGLALLACWLPARAAARVPPTVALAAGSRHL